VVRSRSDDFGKCNYSVGSDFDENSSLHDAGLDSMATMQLLIKIEQTFGVQLPATKLTKENMASVASLAKII
jgi:acyl carrier protein